MSQYPKYKDSGVEWIGSIPSDWNVFKVKELTILRQHNLSVEKLAKNIWYYYDIPTIQKTGKGRVEKGENIESNKYLLEGNEILVSKLNPRKGTIVKSESNREFPIICSTELIPVVPENINDDFLYYILRNPLTADVFNSMVTSVTNSHQRINPKDIENFLISAPDRNTQEIISSYLDYKTSEIDSLISDKERLIELLEEKRQAVTTETVTKGLDPNVKMKDSGIEWIGEIPEHWEVTKLKRITELIGDGLHGTPKYSNDGEYYFINGNNLQNKSIVINDSTNRVNEDEFNKYKKELNENTILISLNGTIGNLAFYNSEPVVLGKSAGYIRLNKGQIKEFIYYVLKSNFVKNSFSISLIGTTIPNLSLDTMRNIVVTLPSKNEQCQIVKFLDVKNRYLDRLITNLSNQIELLKEYRESLIYEAVTGKIDVRDYVTETEEVH